MHHCKRICRCCLEFQVLQPICQTLIVGFTTDLNLWAELGLMANLSDVFVNIRNDALDFMNFYTSFYVIWRCIVKFVIGDLILNNNLDWMPCLWYFLDIYCINEAICKMRKWILTAVIARNCDCIVKNYGI